MAKICEYINYETEKICGRNIVRSEGICLKVFLKENWPKIAKNVCNDQSIGPLLENYARKSHSYDNILGKSRLSQQKLPGENKSKQFPAKNYYKQNYSKIAWYENYQAIKNMPQKFVEKNEL